MRNELDAGLCQALVEQPLVGVYVFDEQHFLYVNRAFAGTFGYLPEEVIGRLGPLEVTHPEDRPLVQEKIRRRLSGRVEGAHYVFRGLRKDGSLIWCVAFGRRVEHQGRPAIIGTLVEITERVRAEKELTHLNLVLRAIRSVNQLITREKDRTRLLQGACENLIQDRGYRSAWIAILDADRKLITASQAGLGKAFAPLERMLKQGKLSECGRRALNHPGVTVIEDTTSSCGDCPLLGREPGKMTMTIRLEYEAKIYGIMSVSLPAKFALGEEEQLIFSEVAEDISFALHNIEVEEERVRAEKELRESEEQFRLLAENVTDAIWTMDMNLRPSYVSPSVKQLCGFTPEEAMARSWEEMLAPGSRKLVRRVFQEELGLERSGRGDPHRGRTLRLEMMCKDGSTVWVEGKVSLLRDEDGRPVGIIGVARDISERVQTEEAMRRALWGAVKVAGKIAERRDPYTAGHQRRVAQLACAIAEELGLPKDQVEGIQVAALLHDIGKVTVPSEILTKPGELSAMEFELIKTHAAVGADILEGIDFSWPVARIVRQHHERLDGSGYPQGLKDDEILLEARIIGVADVVEAMASHRPYRPARGIDKALEEIKKNKDVLYDPQVAEACVKLFEEGRFKFHKRNNKY